MLWEFLNNHSRSWERKIWGCDCSDNVSSAAKGLATSLFWAVVLGTQGCTCPRRPRGGEAGGREGEEGARPGPGIRDPIWARWVPPALLNQRTKSLQSGEREQAFRLDHSQARPHSPTPQLTLPVPRGRLAWKGPHSDRRVANQN